MDTDFTPNYRLVPANNKNLIHKKLETGHPDYPAVHDTFRHGFHSVKRDLEVGHPLESRLVNWDSTQAQLKYTLQRNLFGLHMPLRQHLEKKLVSSTFKHNPVISTSTFSRDILEGKDDSIGEEDIFNDPKLSTQDFDPHLAMERAWGL